MNQQIISHTDAVFRRTMKGQAAVMPSIAPELDEDHHRLLLLVNGFTRLETLSKFCPFCERSEHVALSLKTSGLIEEVGPMRHSDSRRSTRRLADQ